jgi:hypothetical protein
MRSSLVEPRFMAKLASRFSMSGGDARSGAYWTHTRRGAPEGRPKAAATAGAKSGREFCQKPGFRGTICSLLLVALPAVAFAEDAGPHHVRAGIQLGAADEQLKLLYAVITAKEFDVELSKTLSADIKRAVGDAKSSAFRASALLGDAEKKAEPDFKKLQDGMKRVEDATAKLDEDLKEETAGLKPDEDAEESEEAKMPSWELLKDDAGALAKEISDARALHSKLAKMIKLPQLKAPPPPKKK